MLTHVVIFWLNDSIDKKAAIAQLQRDAESLLRDIEEVKHFSIGIPAGTDRPVVDNTYDVALCTIYDDRAGHDRYQVHPNHQQFLANNRANFKKTLIYDFM